MEKENTNKTIAIPRPLFNDGGPIFNDSGPICSQDVPTDSGPMWYFPLEKRNLIRFLIDQIIKNDRKSIRITNSPVKRQDLIRFEPTELDYRFHFIVSGAPGQGMTYIGQIVNGLSSFIDRESMCHSLKKVSKRN